MQDKSKRIFGVFSAIFIVGLLIALPLTVYHILYSIDPSTHFYYDNAKFVLLTDGILVVLTVALVLPFFFPRAGKSTVLLRRKKYLAVISILMAAALIFSSVYDILHTFSSTMGVGNFLTGLSGLLAVIFFLGFAIDWLSGKHVDLRLIALLPVLWGIVNLISTFMSLTQIANISEYLYQILQMVFAVLFLYYNARLVGEVPNGREINGAFAFGLPCALFGILASVPPFAAHLINSGRGNMPAAHDAVFIMMSVYIIAVLFSLLFEKQEKK